MTFLKNIQIQSNRYIHKGEELTMTGKYMYDCYDKDEKPLGIFFEDGTKEL